MSNPNPTELEEALRTKMNNLELENMILVSMLTVIFPSVMAHQEASEDGSDNYWGWVTYLDIPTGQISFQIGEDSHCTWFEHLKKVASPWDKHDPEEKWKRIAAFIDMSMGSNHEKVNQRLPEGDRGNTQT